MTENKMIIVLFIVSALVFGIIYLKLSRGDHTTDELYKDSVTILVNDTPIIGVKCRESTGGMSSIFKPVYRCEGVNE